jgi:hypothetical protein
MSRDDNQAYLSAVRTGFGETVAPDDNCLKSWRLPDSQLHPVKAFRPHRLGIHRGGAAGAVLNYRW